MTLAEAIAEAVRLTKGKNISSFDIASGTFGIFRAEEIATILNAVASGDLIPVQCCMCGKTGLSVAEDGGPECQLDDGRWTCSRECWEKASGDLIPKADAEQAVALAYQRAVERIAANLQPCSPVYPAAWTDERLASYEAGQLDAAISFQYAILALAPAEPLAEVVRLREALTLIERIYYLEEKDAAWKIARMNGIARAAQDGEDITHYKRIFHRAALAPKGETE